MLTLLFLRPSHICAAPAAQPFCSSMILNLLKSIITIHYKILLSLYSPRVPSGGAEDGCSDALWAAGATLAACGTKGPAAERDSANGCC